MAEGYTNSHPRDEGAFYFENRFYWSSVYNASTNSSTVTFIPQIITTYNMGNDLRMWDKKDNGGGIYRDGTKIFAFPTDIGVSGTNYIRTWSNPEDTWVDLYSQGDNYPTLSVNHNASGDASIKLGLRGGCISMYYDPNTGVYPSGYTSWIDDGFYISIHENAPYTISYNANNGSGAPNAQSVYAGVSYTLSSTTPIRTGYSFNGWNTKVDGTGTDYAAGQQNVTVSGNLVLYAKWTKNSYNVTLSAGDYIASVSGGGSKLYDTSVTVTATLSSATGYTTTFDGWYNGSTKVSSSLSYTFTMGASDISLIAKGTRTINSYTVSVSAGSNIASVSGGGTKTYGSSFTVSAVLGSATGYTYSFDGWYSGDTRVSTSQSYTFTLGAANVSLTAKANRSVNSYTLSVSQGAGSTIVVNRTSSPNKGAATGILSNGSTIYYGDILSITISANTGYNIGTHTVNGSSWTSGNYTVTGAVTVISTASLKTYTLSITTSLNGVTTNIRRLTSPIGGGSIRAITNGTTLYYNDTLAISYTVGGAYQLLTATVNNIDISGQALPYNVTVNNNIVVSITVKLGAIIYIANEAYQIFIGDGTNWNQYQAFIGNGSEFDQY